MHVIHINQHYTTHELVHPNHTMCVTKTIKQYILFSQFAVVTSLTCVHGAPVDRGAEITPAHGQGGWLCKEKQTL